jgi:hypothetical protein
MELNNLPLKAGGLVLPAVAQQAGKAGGAHVRSMGRVCSLMPPCVMSPCLSTLLTGGATCRVQERAHRAVSVYRPLVLCQPNAQATRGAIPSKQCVHFALIWVSVPNSSTRLGLWITLRYVTGARRARVAHDHDAHILCPGEPSVRYARNGRILLVILTVLSIVPRLDRHCRSRSIEKPTQ